MKINVCSETKILNMQGEGVNTAFLNCVELLREDPELDVVINNEGVGDIMHSHTYGPYYFLRGLRYRQRKILTVHVIPDSIKGSIPAAKILMPWVRWYFKKVFSYADVCIAISPMVEQVIKDLGAKTTILRLDNPILLDTWKRNPELRKKGRALLGLQEDDFCVLGVGQLEGRKGCEDFIEIGKKVPGAEFRWIGGRPFGILTEGILRLNRLIASAPSNIKFSGLFPFSEMACIYAAADLFIFPSYQENCPLAPMEAAASGMPVIYRNILEYSLLYKNNYLKANNNDEFVEQVKSLMDDKEAYEDGLKISKTLISQFSKHEIKKQLIQLYSDLDRVESGLVNA